MKARSRPRPGFGEYQAGTDREIPLVRFRPADDAAQDDE